MFLISLAAGAISIYATRWGPWALSDSVEYVEAARNLALGRGLVLIRASGNVVPLTLRPPFYPMVLAVTDLLGMEMIGGARLLDVVLFATFLLVLGSTFQLLIQSQLLTISVTLFALSSPIILSSFTGAMSEPLFLTLGTASLLAIAWYLQRSTNRWVLIGSAVCAGFAFLSRFVGIAVVTAGALSMALLSARTWRRRISDVVLFAIIGVTPFLIWSLGLLRSGTRPGAYNLPATPLWEATAPVRIAVVNMVWNWIPINSLFPEPAYDPKLNILVAIALGTLIGVLVTARARGISPLALLRQPAIQLAFILASFAAAYAVFLATTYILVTVPRPALIERLLFPIPFTLFLSFLSLLYFVGTAIGVRSSGVLPLAVSLAFVAANFQAASELVTELHHQGLGFTSRAWRSSDVIAALDGMPDKLDFISNEPDAILFFLERPAFGIPELEAEQPLVNFSEFGHEMNSAAERAFRQEGAALVLFDNAFWQFDALYYSATEQRMNALTSGLYVHAELPDGTIYFSDGAKAP